MLPSGRYSEIVAQDILEHLPRTSTVAVLKEWSRLLQDGGLLHIRVPSVIDLVELLKAPENQAVERQEMFVQCLFGTQAYTEDTHFTTFTEPILRNYLSQAALAPTTWRIYDGWLFEVDSVKVRQQSKPASRRQRLAHLASRLSFNR